MRKRVYLGAFALGPDDETLPDQAQQLEAAQRETLILDVSAIALH